ncbi:molecular chaperone [Vibrio sp. SM6]|uniref:Molecular chaperone n=1 Tax=Vibrio agarilyticus TaxID=2726741 RepID=A0A7X8TP02_9VIBR|nr:molecular chaperone [Vibrio agarilyticus]NLS12017.1 molecular chaperone [Vibrio agarilyticus]
MAIGFDYGTANCSVAHVVDQQVVPIPLVGDQRYISSTLCAPTAETVSEYLFRCLNIRPSDATGELVLRRAIELNREEGLEVRSDDVLFGMQALDHYLEDPKNVYYIKSPKSFLGAMGLRDVQLSFFEDLVCAMMANIKSRAEQHLQRDISETVIGRPVNFLGRGGERSNQQAEGILRRAATRAGFKSIEFQFEPVAAGLEYEATLTTAQNVLVVDIGGGTTDCSMIQMGPQWVGKTARDETLLAHTGQLVGGNDLDTHIAFHNFMREFGLGSNGGKGADIPQTQFWNPIMISDVQAQRTFYSRENLQHLQRMLKQSTTPHYLQRLIAVHQGALGYGIVREAEKAKIALEQSDLYCAHLNLLIEQLDIPVARSHMEAALEKPVSKMVALAKEAITQAGIQPDAIFMTGGSARSHVLREAMTHVAPTTPIVSGSYFGSVTAGLARWAKNCYGSSTM